MTQVQNPKNEFLQSYLFHYNPYTSLFAAFKREDANEYLNNNKTEKAIKNHDVNNIIEYLIKEENK